MMNPDSNEQWLLDLCDQIKRERDTAIAQLKELGYELGEKPKTGHWIYENYNWRCSECNEAPKTLGYVGTVDFMTEHFKFCNHCGAKMNVTPESEE